MPCDLVTYLHGCNYPWSADGTTIYYGLDFGASIWGSHLGVSTRRPAVARDFDAMAALGFTVVRWFVFCDGRAGIVYDDRGVPAGLDPYVFSDLDAALDMARGAGIRLDLVLLDHRWMFRRLRHAIADPATGALFEARLPEGRARVLLSEAGREGLFDSVFAPLVGRYGPGGARADLGAAVAAYEFMNEPDFIIEEWERDLSPDVPHPLPFELVADLVARLSGLVHREHPGVLTTIGCARAHNLWAWDDDALGLDVLQVHSYPDARHPGREDDIMGTPASALDVRRRVILGEIPGNPDARPGGVTPPATSLEEYLEFAVSGGYLGGWPWSFSGTDVYGRLPVEPLRRFAARHPELVNPRARAR
ncbi:MAG: hypothetical protein HY824_08220 [Acidobacteria bacterium]|nr:hypothetical protein [Acidobacteriota bacterium]